MSIPAHRVLERLTLTAPLGVAFWDPALGRPVSEGVAVRVAPEGEIRRGRMTEAHANRAGIFVVHHLPGLREFEGGAGDDDFWSTLPPERRFRVEVTDTLGRYAPIVFHVGIPRERGPVRPECASELWFADPASPLDSPPKIPGYVPLFSTAARRVPPGRTAIRATLADAMSGAPAEQALLEVWYDGRLLGRGLSDDRGEVMAVVAYPEPPLPASPPGSGSPPVQQPLGRQLWPLEVTIRYQPPLARYPSPVPGVELGDLCDIVRQAPATIASASPAGEILDADLEFGSELILGGGAAVLVQS